MSKSISKLLPVLFGFFIMGFCDIVGFSTSYVQKDFNLNETLAGFIPSMVFVWFLLLSMPVAITMNRIGRKRMVQVSNVITILGMLIPFVHYDLVTCMSAFVLLGIGNTILQVSLNPLLTNVVDGKALTSSLTAGQVVKAVSSFCGPFVASFAVSVLGNWQYLFPIYAGVTLLSTIWLMTVNIVEKPMDNNNSSMGDTFALLTDKVILMLFLGIFFVVGVDVGTNTVAPKLLMERCGMGLEQAGYGSSVYFICRTAGAFLGSILLARINEIIYFRMNIFAAMLAMAALFFAQGMTSVLVLIGLIGFFCSSIFSLIYSAAMKKYPKKANEISGLMIMGIFGGAVIPPLMGVMADAMQCQIGSLLVISCCIIYLMVCSMWMTQKN